MNRRDRRRAAGHGPARPVIDRDALARDAGRRLAELCADHDRARRSYAVVVEILSISLDHAVLPTGLPLSAQPLMDEKTGAMRDAIALMTAGLGFVLKGGES